MNFTNQQAGTVLVKDTTVKTQHGSMRRCLIISPHFPPSTLAGVHRARHLAKHLQAHGWEPAVVAVHPRHHAEALDPALRALVPPRTRIAETGAIPMRLTAWFGLRGEVGLRGYFHLRAEVARQIESFAPLVVLITGSPFYPMLLSSWIQRRYGVPVVLDLQDPWASKDGAARKRWTKGWLAHQLAMSLEPRALAGASWVTSVSKRQNVELAERHPWFDSKRMSAIAIGGDPDDFDAMRSSPSRTQTVRLDPSHFNICYVGTFLPRAGDIVRTLFQAAARLSKQIPQSAARIRFVFVGTSNQPAGATGNRPPQRVMPIAVQEGVQDMVTEHSPRVPFLEALGLLANANAIVILGSDEPHYTASKIYPALMSGRPWLSIFHEGSSAHDTLRAAGGGIALAYRGPDAREQLICEVVSALARLVQDSGSVGAVDPTAYAAFTAHAVAGQFAHVFEAALS